MRYDAPAGGTQTAVQKTISVGYLPFIPFDGQSLRQGDMSMPLMAGPKDKSPYSGQFVASSSPWNNNR